MLALQAVGAVGVLTDPRKEPLEYLKGCAVEIPVKAVVDGGVFTHCATGAQTPLDVFALPRESWLDQNLSAKEPGFIIFTSGSTGKSKPMMLSQYNLVNNLVDSEPLGAYSQSDSPWGRCLWIMYSGWCCWPVPWCCAMPCICRKARSCIRFSPPLSGRASPG